VPLEPDHAARLRSRVRTLKRDADNIAARVRGLQGEIASLRTAVALVLDEMDQLAPVGNPPATPVAPT